MPEITPTAPTAPLAFRILRLPLVTEPWQRDLLMKRMDLCRSIYNAELDAVNRQYERMRADPRYDAYHAVIDRAYRLHGERRQQAKGTDAYREAVAVQGALFREYGFTAYSFHERAIADAKRYAGLLPTRVAHFTIGDPLWRRWHDVLTNRRRAVHHRAAGAFTSITSDGRSGIRLVEREGHNCRGGIDLARSADEQQLYAVYGRGTGRRALRLPIKLDDDDAYARAALCKPLHVISIVRREQHGHWKFYVQLTIEI